MSKINNILSGWKNFIAKSEVSEEIAVQRAVHCVSCVELKEGRLLNLIKDDLKEIEGFYCGLCYCPLSAKLRSEKETCLINKW
jgi:hypothetical protein